MKWLGIAFVLVALSSIAFAQSVDKVIVVSDVTSADFLIAKSAGEKSGIPVLIAANGEITAELKAQLAELMSKTVILIGGPAVIKPEAEADLSASGYLVIRIWGLERTATAIEAAKYFWREGASCTVLADDTKNSDDDTELQSSASNLAAHKKCLFIPVPNGTMPADILSTLQDLGSKEIFFISKHMRMEIKDQLKQFKLKEKNDTDDVDEEILNETPQDKRKLVIVAAPNWKHVFGTGGQTYHQTIVRIVSNANQTPMLIELINSRNITDIRVVGFPALAQQIADQLNASNIAVKRISGERASEVAHRVLKDLLGKWNEKRRDAENKEAISKERIKARLLLVINSTEQYLDAWLVRLDKLAAEGADAGKISQLKELIADAKSRLGEIRRKVLEGDVAGAERLLFEVRNSFEKAKFRFRLEIKWRIDDEVEAEEDDVGKLEIKLDLRDLENRFGELRGRCVNITAVESLVERAKALRDEMKQAREEGNHTRTAEIARSGHGVAEQARALGDICNKRGEISDKLRKIAEELVERKTEKTGTTEKIEIQFRGLNDGRVNQSLQVTWNIKSPVMKILHTAVHYDYTSHPGTLGKDVTPEQAGYPMLTTEFAAGNFTVPRTFQAQILPDKEGTLHLRAHTLINGGNYWTEERKAEIKPQARGTSG